MAKFIQVQKLVYTKDKKYVSANFESLLNVDDVSEIVPRDIEDDKAFQNKCACCIHMKNGDAFFVIGTLTDIKNKL